MRCDSCRERIGPYPWTNDEQRRRRLQAINTAVQCMAAEVENRQEVIKALRRDGRHAIADMQEREMKYFMASKGLLNNEVKDAYK